MHQDNNLTQLQRLGRAIGCGSKERSTSMLDATSQHIGKKTVIIRNQRPLEQILAKHFTRKRMLRQENFRPESPSVFLDTAENRIT